MDQVASDKMRMNCKSILRLVIINAHMSQLCYRNVSELHAALSLSFPIRLRVRISARRTHIQTDFSWIFSFSTDTYQDSVHMIALFHNISNSIFINEPMIWLFVISATTASLNITYIKNISTPRVIHY